MRRRLTPAVILALTLVAGCAFVPAKNNRLEEVRGLYAAAMADPTLARLAPNEMRRATETFSIADTSWNTLGDSAVVDHLSYVARQRLAIARETARRVHLEGAALLAKESISSSGGRS
jgi:hypothetical protein